MPSKQYQRISKTFLLAVLLAGCGVSDDDAPIRAAVEGTVTLDNQPLQEGIIRFVPTSGTTGPKTSVVVTDGRFSVDAENGPIVGIHRIEIESTDDGGFALDNEQALDQLHASGMRRIEVVQIPTQYNRNSTLTENVTAEGPNQFQFTLVSSGGQ